DPAVVLHAHPDRQSGWLRFERHSHLLLANCHLHQSDPDDPVHESAADWIGRGRVPKRVHSRLSDEAAQAENRPRPELNRSITQAPPITEPFELHCGYEQSISQSTADNTHPPQWHTLLHCL